MTLTADQLIDKDLQHIWHPCSQMKDYEQFRPMVVTGAKGAYIELEDGRRLIDAISSWWCKPLGHGHDRLRQALINQAQQFEHVLLANTSNQVIVELSSRLAQLTTNLNYVSYASDGACAIEMAIKMSLHARQILGQKKRTQFAALTGAYHGETCTALGMSDLGIYSQPYQALLPKVTIIENIPYVSGTDDPLWHDCSAIWPSIEKQLETQADSLTAIIVEPIAQGAGGMLIYSADFLKRLRAWCTAHDVHLIADEIMTAFGRTGLPLACQHADIEPDFLCLGKGLTGGWLPLSAILTSNDIYQLFYGDYATGKSFLHSHTYSGNPLAAAVALEFLKVLDDEKIYNNIPTLSEQMLQGMQSIADNTGQLHNIRSLGAIVAADLVTNDPNQRRGYQIFQKATQLGALLRPLGNTLYWLPPLNTSSNTINGLQHITEQAIIDSNIN